MRSWLVAGVALLGLGNGGCAMFGGGDEDTTEPPAELVPFDTALSVRRLWSARLGRGSEALRLGLTPATDGARVYAGSHDGAVSAFEAESGRRAWSVRTDLALAAGPGYGGGLLVFGTTDGELLALDAQTGEERWRQFVGAEVLAAPAIAGDVIALRTVDGRLRGFSRLDGREMWAIVQSVPALTMRGNTAPAIARSAVVTGFDNGRLGAYELASGDPLWEITVATPTGLTELDRLVDISAGLQVVGNDVYAVGYHGRALAVALETGLVLWQHEISSFSGLGVDWNTVYVTDEFSEIVALQRSSGTPLWRQDALRLRDVTAPTAYANAIVVGDFEGYLHWLRPDDGSFLARQRVGTRRITSAPLVVGENLFAQSEDGTLAAYTIVSEDAS